MHIWSENLPVQNDKAPHRPGFLLLRSCSFGLIMLLSLPVHAEQVQDSSSATSHLLSIRPGIELEIVEWGGEGESVVFLAALGHTAHVFDEFAPRFCGQFRVLGITRRGHGLSSKPETGYDLATLAEDIRIVLDSLQIKRAILAGHSVAGDEMTKFASTYPERVTALVYIEAA
ncbi:MAG: alpha/beta fold hydrolase, partial [Candidatus Zixiibacteriota bacterium]